MVKSRILMLSLSAVVALTACSSRLDLSRSSTQMKVGVDMARKDLWREARFRFERATQIDPTNPRAFNDLAVAYEATGEYEKAREAYLQALKLDRGNAQIQKNYSRFVEFYTRNEKRTKEQVSTGSAADESSGSAAPQGTPEPVPAQEPQNEPPQPPVSTPPDPAPDPDSAGGVL